MAGTQFTFRQFIVRQERCAMKVGTDGVLLGAWAAGGRRILDIGTGTGLVALMMAQRFPDSEVVGVDIDDEAVAQACENVLKSPFAARVSVIRSAIQDFYSSVFDTIVSNPPYFHHSLKNPDSRRSLARHTDSLSYRDLMKAASRLLTPEGNMSIVLPADAIRDVESEAVIYGFFSSKRYFIKTKASKPPKRVLLEFSRQPPAVCQQLELCLTDGTGNRSDWYHQLTKNFYLF